MDDFKNIAVLGAGNWGTTLAVMLAGKGYGVRLWEYRRQLAEQIQSSRENRIFLPDVKLPPGITVTSELAEAVHDVEAMLLAVPSQTVRQVCQELSRLLTGRRLLISCVKGLEHGSLKRMSQVIAEVLEGRPCDLVALSGPNIAYEIAQGLPATAVVAGENPEAVIRAQSLMHTQHYRVYTCADLVGVEMGGSLKNVIAIASGILDGLGYGANTKGALIARGLAEIVRLGLAMGARAETFYGLSGLGDLATTCFSDRSRNRQVGMQIGRGRRLSEILKNLTMVAEGVPTTESAKSLAEMHGVEMPITLAVHQILFEDKDPKKAVAELMAREAKPE